MAQDLFIADKPEEMYRAAARRMVAALGEVLSIRPRAFLCLSGGSTPAGLYRLMSGPEFRSRIPWDRIEFFWGDERGVPPDHRQSNYRMAQESLLEHLEVGPAQVHRIPGEMPDAAVRYARDLAAAFKTAPEPAAPPQFDLVLLGVGVDGHTAGLFPNGRVLAETSRWVVDVNRPDDLKGITLTIPVLTAARQVHFLAVGEDKSEAIRAVIEDEEGDPHRWPARLVARAAPRVVWFLDRAAAFRLRRSH